MEFRFGLSCVLFLVIAANCNKLHEFSAEDFVTRSPPFWCPEGYEPMKADGDWLHACKPINCPGSTEDDHARCRKMDTAFISCPKKLNMRDVWNIYVSAGDLRKHLEYVEVEPGYYEVKYNGTVICDPYKLEEDFYNGNVDAKWCMPLNVPKDGYDNSSSKPFVYGLNRQLDFYSFENDESVRFCSPIDPSVARYCNIANIAFGSHLAISFNTSNGVITFDGSPRANPDLGIFGTVDKSFVLFCENFTEGTSNPMRPIYDSAETTSVPLEPTAVPMEPMESMAEFIVHLHGYAAFISALSVLFVLVLDRIQFILNEHYAVFLCYALSIVVSSVAKGICFFSDSHSEAGSMILFGLEYIFSVGAYYWVTVLAFDLLRCKREPIYGKSNFFGKCFYSWGIPAMFYLFTIVLHFNPNVQNMYGIDFGVWYTSCHQNYKTKLVVFYMPMFSTLVKCFFCGLLIMRGKCDRGDSTKVLDSKFSKNTYQVCLQLFVLMTCCWLLEICTAVAYYVTGVDVWNVTDCINNLIGFFIFAIFILNSMTLTKPDKISETNTCKIEMPETYTVKIKMPETNTNKIKMSQRNMDKMNICWPRMLRDVAPSHVRIDPKLREINEPMKR